MANFHLNSQPYLAQLSYDQERDMILEIGSDQNEGSTEFFNGLAVNWEIPFYTVDVIDEARHRFTHCDHIIWQVSEGGAVWTKTVLPTLSKQIKVLYLDNADNIKENYAQRNVEWSNLGSQVEHLAQMINCMPYMAAESLVICDDTPLVEASGTYSGKCGAVVPYLIANGYQIVYTGNNGVILQRSL